LGTPGLVVEVVDTDRGARQEFRFGRTPVRVGRSPLNDLPLDRNFVSNCHGIIHFDARQCEFVDLGSTNGTLLDGRQISKNQPVAISQHSVLSIGALELRFRQAEGSSPDTHASYAFRPNELGQELAGKVSLGAASRGRPSPGPAAGAPIAARRAPLPIAERLVPIAERLAPLHAQYRNAWAALLAELTAVGDGGAREQTAGELLARFPELAQEADFRRWAGTDRAASARPSAPPTAPSAPPAAAGQLIEYFAKAFLELSRGRRQFAKDLSLSTGERSRLSDIDDARALVAYLLDPAAQAERLDELSRACADIMLHQVALLNGVAAGARELLEELSPVAIQLRHGGLLHVLLRPFGYDRRWSGFRQRFEDLKEETALTSRLLGRAFARAYAASMGLGSGQINRPFAESTDRS
jgi:predicted component of type VI protein secretion system